MNSKKGPFIEDMENKSERRADDECLQEEVLRPIAGNYISQSETHKIKSSALGTHNPRFDGSTQFLTSNYAGEKIVGIRTFSVSVAPSDSENVETVPFPACEQVKGEDKKGDDERQEGKNDSEKK